MLRICSGFLFIPGFSLNDEKNGKELRDYPKVKQAGKNLYAGKTQHIADQLINGFCLKSFRRQAL